MQLKAILNRVVPHKGFVFGTCCFSEDSDQPQLLVTIAPRAGSRGMCSGCGRRCPGYDKLPERQFQFIPMWGFLVFFL